MEGKVLVVQLARLGDLVQTWPLLRRLRHHDPGRHLELLTDSRLRALQTLGPEVDHHWELDLAGLPLLAQRDFPSAYERVRRWANGLKNQGYDLVYNLNFSRLSLLLAYLVGGEVKGYQPVQGGREFLREPWLALVFALVHARQVNRLHLSDVFRHLAPATPPEPRPATLALGPKEPVIALQVATRHSRRTWPLEAFTRLAGLLVDRLGSQVWLVGTKAERPQGETLRRGLTPAHRERVVNLQGKTDLQELAARLREAHLLVSGDTGTLHLAATLGTRTLGVFLGPASCFETGPYGDGHYVFQAKPPCHPCAEAGAGCPEPICQAMITPDAVADLVVSLYTEGEVFTLPRLPAGTRLYRSFYDSLGVNYASLKDGLRFIDLVGQAYRCAGARLLGLTCPTWQIPFLPLGEEDRRNLEGLAAALNNGGSLGMTSPLLAEALTPLQASREEMHRQQLIGRDRDEAETCLASVVKGFRTGLQEFVTGGEP
ncbi:MAG: glycosyltransferase family 9 protein [Syntrophobacterales bacterium]|jgi:ADP-heptose:LPS heptosyltransferase